MSYQLEYLRLKLQMQVYISKDSTLLSIFDYIKLV